MTDHAKGDAYDLIRTEVQLELRLYKRRWQKDAEMEYDREVAELVRTEQNYDPREIARGAVSRAKHRVLPVAPRPVIELGNGS